MVVVTWMEPPGGLGIGFHGQAMSKLGAELPSFSPWTLDAICLFRFWTRNNIIDESLVISGPLCTQTGRASFSMFQ